MECVANKCSPYHSGAKIKLAKNYDNECRKTKLMKLVCLIFESVEGNNNLKRTDDNVNEKRKKGKKREKLIMNGNF